MNRIKLTGLVMMMTTVLLVMAAVITQTSHVSVGNFTTESWYEHLKQQPTELPSGVQPAPSAPTSYRTIPVLWPLAFFGILGSLLWFFPGAAAPRSNKATKPRRASSRRGSSFRVNHVRHSSATAPSLFVRLRGSKTKRRVSASRSRFSSRRK